MKGLQWMLLGVLCCAGIVSSITREYFLAIKEIQWDYAPSGINLIQNKTIKEDEEARVFLERGEQRIGRVYKKAVYLQYTDATYRQEIEKPKWLGYLGPLISAEEDDVVIVHLKNMAKRAYSIHAHGLSYNKSNEGALYPDSSEKVEKADDSVAPEKSFTYIWTLSASHTPGKDDTNCLTRIYHSHVNAPKDIASGLIGPLVICKKGSLDVHGDKTADYLYALMFTVSDENLSWYLDENIKTYCSAPAKVNKDDEGFQESNKMHSINGYVYGNLPDLSMCMGNKIHWHLFGMGNEVDLHSAFFHGQILTDKRHHVDTVSLFPATFVNVEMVADNPGQWLLSCQVNDHLEAGMQAIFEIKKCFPNVHKPRPFGEVRQYYIAAEEIIWDYGPTGINQYSGKKLRHNTVEKCRFWNRQSETMLHQKKYYIAAVEMDWDYSPTRTWEEQMYHSLKDSPGNEFLKKEGKFIGSKYKKVLYREYTDDTFTKPKERSADMEHLGIMGPMIHGKVGEKVKIVFKNMAKRPYSIHAHGVKTDSPQVALTRPGETQTYTWYLPKNSGPTEEQEECSVGVYYSTVDVIKDMYSGLIGPLVICKKSLARTLGLKKEIEEFALLFVVFDENESWYLDDNIKAHVKNPPNALKEDEEFIESNKMHGINGLVYGNLKGLNMKVGDKVYWYLMGMGNEVDIHTAHFHGHSFDYKVSGTHRADVFDLFPGTFQTVTMRPLYSGTWLLHCHVTDHIQAGMETTYTVRVQELLETTRVSVKEKRQRFHEQPNSSSCVLTYRSIKRLLPLSAERRMVLSFPVALVLSQTSGKSFCHHRDWRESGRRRETINRDTIYCVTSPLIPNPSKDLHLC
uniref:ferroxidase n=1 Tax=Sinocyclocheilus rhinocerous TaxID=307959 RepID=A0A673MK80_9TELE